MVKMTMVLLPILMQKNNLLLVAPFCKHFGRIILFHLARHVHPARARAAGVGNSNAPKSDKSADTGPEIHLNRIMFALISHP